MEEQSYTPTHPLGHIRPVMGSLYLSLPISIISSPTCFGKLSGQLQGDIFDTKIQL